MSARHPTCVLIGLLGIAGCSSNPTPGAESSPGVSSPNDAGTIGEVTPPQGTIGGVAEADCQVPDGECALVACTAEQALGTHVELCSPIEYATNPPSSGMHYAVWANFQVYEQAIARGFYVHSIEHGAVVLLYNCELVEARGDDCAELASLLADFVADQPIDPLCEAPERNRLLVVPDPLLDVPFAATAWGHLLRGDCFDTASVQAFVDAHYGNNYEDTCARGLDPTLPAAEIPGDCGE